ncbi:MAG: AAA family ATPase, partial [Candidatus Caenarcaniphilales bacterium]|nr:AAA family ATPase [Candidatus Caenarcaniphilales bacterium]
MAFCGRQYELDLLRKELDSSHASLIAIYGRRRVGKTRLVKEAFAKKLWIFEGVEGLSTKQQIKAVLKSLSDLTENSTYQYLSANNWFQVFEILHEVWQNHGKPVIFFDEVQWLANFRKPFISIFKSFWEKYWSLDKKSVIVFCGSVSSFMTTNIIQSSALYQRITSVIHLEPLSILEVKEFFRDKKRHYLDILDLYMCIGGIPKYWEFVDPNKSSEQNINELFFMKDAKLLKEYELLFHSNFKNKINYQEIVEFLYKNPSSSYKEIAQKTRLSTGGRLTKLLEDLEKAGFIEKITSVDSSDESKKTKFRLLDEYVLFYLKFVKAN